jgi:cellulose synthase/poly-beta-1,6-N-acetylglucosamine synthase-like glycosyltransferase
MSLFGIILEILLYAVGFFLFFNCACLLFFSIAGLKKIKPLKVEIKKIRKFSVIIPAYKEDAMILESSKKALQHSYEGSFDVVVIADGLQKQTISQLKKEGIKVIEVSFERSTKGKALAEAINRLPENRYDIAMVLDVDNIMDEDVLEEVNAAFEAGYKVVQTHRTAKNMNTPFSFLDACNEEINNHIYRKGPFAIGLSSALIGSGMAFEFDYLKKLLQGIGETVGEDKELDFRIAKDNVKVVYLDQVYVFDEKIENARAFTQQRTRWIAAQIELLKKYSKQGFTQIARKGNLNFLNKLLQVWLVPRILLLGILIFLCFLSLVLLYGPPAIFWLFLLSMEIIALAIAMPQRLYKDKRLWQALWKLPYAVVCMFVAMFKLKKIKSSFLATPHSAETTTNI